MAYGMHGLALVLLTIVDFAGSIGMGAQRWLDLGVISLQPPKS
jgi:rod shape determining protein RodA